MKPKRALVTLLTLIMILCSSTLIIPVSAQGKPPEKPPEESPWWKKEKFNGTFIHWDKEQNMSQESWNSSSQAWEFGPYPTFAIYLQNGTEVTDTNYIPLGEPFKAIIDVKKTIFTRNVTLGRAGLNWQANLLAQNGTETGSANCRMVYVNQMNTHYWNESKTWHTESSVFNKSEVLAPPGKAPSPMENGKNTDFYHFNKDLSTVTETDERWIIEIVGYFDSTKTPVGPFSVKLEVTDSRDSWIDFGYVASSGKVSPNRMVAVGKAGLIYGGSLDTWTFEKLDMENNPAYSVSRGESWKIRINVTSSELVNVTVGLELPWQVKTYVNVTGWYSTTVTEYGGWMYNETSGAYYWNSTVPVTQAKQVYGPHSEERQTNVMHDHEVNVTRQYWNPQTGTEEYITSSEHAQDRMYLIYDHSTHSFSVKQGYSYSSYNPDLKRDDEHLVLKPLNTSDPTTRFYNLSISDCTWNQITPGKYVIEFVGSFSNTTYFDRNEFNINQPIVYNVYDRIWPDWETISPSDFQIAVDQLVAITTIIDKNGHEVKGWMFQTDPGNFFIIQSKLQGANVKFKDIDGVGVVFRTSSGNWVSENENYCSDIEIRLVKDFTTGKLTSTTYNRTAKNAYVYGPHKGWKLVNVTDWHQEYNATTGNWEWVESPHAMWNETTITDWHWEYLSLNQTEYALNPNSQKLWINRNEKWIPDDDPAFRITSSYAILNSASISLTEGIATARLNVTFTKNAPNKNYWWEMCFKNMTFGTDSSEGWGEHTISEWTSEPAYYVNGTATGDQAWYVTEPSTPLYTMYSGKKYTLEETPYITVGAEDLLINARTCYDGGRQEYVTEYLFRDPYDPKIGAEPRYYELMNGTKIYVTEAYQAIIRTLKLNTTEAYRITDTGAVPVPNGTVFSTFMDHAIGEWNGELQQNVYYYQLLDGSHIYQNDWFETQNLTTCRWSLSKPVYSENKTALMVDRVGQGVALNYTTVVLLRSYSSSWQPLPDGTGYYLTMDNGTIITHANPWSVPNEERIVTINGLNYTIDWPCEYYKGTYQGQTLMIKRDYVHGFYYTNLGIEGGAKHELPYPCAMATSWWDLERVESESGRLKTYKSITIDGTKYRLCLSEDGKDYYILINEQRVSVPWPMKDIGHCYAEINGEEYWNLTQVGWILQLGTNDERSGQFNSVQSFTTKTGYDPNMCVWSENNRYGYDWENATLYLQALNGTRYDLHSGIYLIVWEVRVGNQTYYTMDDHESWESVYIPETGETLQKPYITDLNGNKVYFDWQTKPANWVNEIHIPIPGTNYTKLIPFTWVMQPVFDTVYIFNITITELQGNPRHTGVFYENGTEVAVGATFKTFGTIRGPGTKGDFNYSSGNLNRAWLPMVQAPWNNSMNVQYLTTLDGTRIYSNNFGWDDGQQNWISSKPWDFNGNPATANITAPVVEGGYAVYLNNTIKVDVTTQWPQGGNPDQYLIMKNGTYFTVHWNDAIRLYFTVINNKTYLFKNAVTYYNFTDSGTVYNIVDPLDSDTRRMLTPTMYNVPTISTDRLTWLWMNATSDRVLYDDVQGYYYLVNASNSQPVRLGLVSDWWTLPESVRRDLFSGVWELENGRPRYNITINGQEYFVIDPSPVLDRWDGEWTIEQNIGRYPASINVTLGGTTYTISLFEGGWWRNSLRWRRYETISLADGTTLEVEQQQRWKPTYQVQIGTDVLDVKLEEMNIYKKHIMWGEIYRWMLTDLQVTSIQSVSNIVVGTPENGMWGIRTFTVVPETGAVDLDGDLTTTNDQYFVRRLHAGSDVWNKTEDRMFVELVWDPNASRIDDEIHIGAWMGKVHVQWTFTWNETYIWYYASNMTEVSPTTMQQINATLINSVTGLPNPGYWDIAHMAKNSTWTDLLARAKKEGMDWIKDNKHEWDWLWFGTQQDFVTGWSDKNGTKMAGIGLRYEFAGLSLYNGTQQTHYFMPENISAIRFVSPGEAFGNMNATGEMVVPLKATITFGATYENVTGTLFPYKEDRSMWGWWDTAVHGADFNEPNFMNRPTWSMVDEISFLVHFSANTTTDLEMNNNASMKIDQHIGNWKLEPNVIDGRKQDVNNVSVYLRGNDVLLNRSLAINYYVTASTGTAWDIKNEKGQILDNNNATESSKFDIAARLANASFATVKMGSTYNWYKPEAINDTIHTLNVTSKTTPIGSFEASYQSEAGKSSTGFEISSMMYFLTVGFSRWDGYAVYNDPEVMFFIYKGMLPPSESSIIWVLIITGAIVTAVATTLIVFRKRVKNAFSRLRRVKLNKRPATKEQTLSVTKGKPELSDKIKT
jgi:hypothetical protein